MLRRGSDDGPGPSVYQIQHKLMAIGDDFWIENGADVTDEVRSSIERASSYASPSAKLTGLTGAYWTQMGEKEHLRWFMPHPEEKLLDALKPATARVVP